MNIEYGLGEIILNGMEIPDKITIKYGGGFFIISPNKNYNFIRGGGKNNSITINPKGKNRVISSNRLFKYIGNIEILSCKVGRRGVRVIGNYIDKWDRLKAGWDDMSLEWDDYIMDNKINTTIKRTKYKELNKNELQHINKTKILY
tara:strand:+ start:1577 stop:2014 length:438 start_codon:yes stop_codon:yes gene_type:complete